MNILITICGRGGSKRLAGKNIKLINDKPLIYYTIKIAKEFSKIYNTEIALSTDDKDIIEISSKYDLTTDYNRPSYLATDSVGKVDVIKDVMVYSENKYSKKYDFVIDLDITSPLRTINDLKKAFNLLQKDKNAYNIFSVSPSFRNPYFNMVEKKSNGYYGKVCEQGSFLTTQSCPVVFDLNASLYIFRRQFFKQNFENAYTPGSLIYEMPHLCFDIDTQDDFDYMEYILKSGKFKFE